MAGYTTWKRDNLQACQAMALVDV